jgi:hypothetical protein
MRQFLVLSLILVLSHILACEGLLLFAHNAVRTPFLSKCGGPALSRSNVATHRRRSNNILTVSMGLETLVERFIFKTLGTWKTALVQASGSASWTYSGLVGVVLSILPNLFYIVEFFVVAYMVYAAVVSLMPLFNPLFWSSDESAAPPIAGKK